MIITDGVLTGFSGVQQMGKAISANFTPVDANSNPLYANNGIAERDAAAGAGGELSVTLDRISRAAMADLFGLTGAYFDAPEGQVIYFLIISVIGLVILRRSFRKAQDSGDETGVSGR